MCFNVLSKLRLFPILLPGGNAFFPDSTASAPSISTTQQALLPADLLTSHAPLRGQPELHLPRDTALRRSRASTELPTAQAILLLSRTPYCSKNKHLLFPDPSPGLSACLSPFILVCEAGKANGSLFLKTRKQTQRSDLGGPRS